MAFFPVSPVPGSVQAGLTSPTYSILTDSNPDSNGKQVYVSALGGTQTGVLVHSVACPFTMSMFKPKVLKTLAPVNPVTGVLRSVPMNTYKFIVRKGVLPLAGQAYKTSHATAEISVPAGADLADPLQLRAMLSLFIGGLVQLSSEIGNTTVTGTI